MYLPDAEDGLGDTVKPRLIEAGADLNRVLVIDDSEVQLTLSDERIEKAIIENNARLVIVDPIQAYLGADVDMNRANEVRPIFMRLGQVAQRTGCAILLIGHLDKAAGMQSLQRGLGSIDIAAAVRSVMFIGKLKHDPTMRILTMRKAPLPRRVHRWRSLWGTRAASAGSASTTLLQTRCCPASSHSVKPRPSKPKI